MWQFTVSTMHNLFCNATHFVFVAAEEDEQVDEREGWDTLVVDGKTVGIRTSTIDDKCQAFETMVIYCSTLGSQFAPYVSQCLELSLGSLRFLYHDGVREACAMYVLHRYSTRCCSF